MHHADVRVRCGRPIELRKDPQEMRQEDAIHAAMPYHEDRFAGALAREPLDDAEHPGDDLFKRLASRPLDETIVGPVRQPADLVERLARAVADIDLAQLWKHLHP